MIFCFVFFAFSILFSLTASASFGHAIRKNKIENIRFLVTGFPNTDGSCNWFSVFTLKDVRTRQVFSRGTPIDSRGGLAAGALAP